MISKKKISICVDCGAIKKSKRGIRCRTCSNILSGKDLDRNKRISIALTGKIFSEKTCAKISYKAKKRYKDKTNHPMFGKLLSDETKKKISDSMLGEKHPQWKGDRHVSSSGYVSIYAPDNPMACGIYVAEHRLVMSHVLGRYLKSNESVHHVNGIRHDNRPENLVIMSNGKHCVHHNKGRILKESTREKLRKKTTLQKRNSNGVFSK